MSAPSRGLKRPALVPPPHQTWSDKVRFVRHQLWATLLSSIFLIFVVVWALVVRTVDRYASSWDMMSVLGFASPGSSPATSRPATPSPGNGNGNGNGHGKPATRLPDWDQPERWKDEKLVKDVRYYARTCGFDIVNETVITRDGYHLRLHRVVDPTCAHERHSDGKGE